MDLNNFDKNYLLIIIGLLAIIIEVILGAPTGFDLLLMGIIFMIGGALGYLTSSFLLALITITILSFLYIAVGRRKVQEKLSVVTHKTNIDNLMGKKARVIKTITSEKPGQVKVEGEIWRAESLEHIEVGQEVVIKSVSGVTLSVDLAK